jgi:hypothetical protein
MAVSSAGSIILRSHVCSFSDSGLAGVDVTETAGVPATLGRSLCCSCVGGSAVVECLSTESGHINGRSEWCFEANTSGSIDFERITLGAGGGIDVLRFSVGVPGSTPVETSMCTDSCLNLSAAAKRAFVVCWYDLDDVFKNAPSSVDRFFKSLVAPIISARGRFSGPVGKAFVACAPGFGPKLPKN